MIVDFRSEEFGPVAGQDYGLAVVSGDGSSVTLQGNTWKVFPYPVAIEAGTELKVEFTEVAPGEIQGLGFTSTTSPVIDPACVFQFAGSQKWGDQTYKGQSGPLVIPVGERFVGVFTHLVFINDQDVPDPSASCSFSNVELFNPAEDQAMAALIEIRDIAIGVVGV